MATDGATNSDSNLSWPGDDPAVTTLQAYCEKLVRNDYLKGGDLQKILTAPGANSTVTVTADDPAAVSLGGRSALKVHRVTGTDASTTIFATTANYTYNTALPATAAPYGDKGFVVLRKGGDGSVFRKNQATQANTGGDFARFQNAVGVLTADATAESATTVLTNPQ